MNVLRFLVLSFTFLCFFISRPALAENGSFRPFVTDPNFDTSTWSLTFDDEFVGNTLDHTKLNWDFQNGPSYYNHLLCSRWETNADEHDGILSLYARKGADPRVPDQPWTAASAQTKRSFLYGYFEARYRYAEATGIDNAFWIMPAKANDFEADIDEGLDVPGVEERVTTNVHTYWNGIHKMDGLEIKPALPDTHHYHVYGFLWTETDLVWYVDGKAVRHRVNDCCHNPGLVRLAIAVPESWAGPVTDATDGKSMDVDYVRVYKLNPHPFIQDAKFDHSNWKLKFSSEFNANDEDNWDFREGATNPDLNLASRRRYNAVTENGVLKLIARHEAYYGQDWTTGSASTKQSFLYGYFESRYRYAISTITSSAFWIMPALANLFEIGINHGRSEFSKNEHVYINRVNINIVDHREKPSQEYWEAPALKFWFPVYHVFGFLWGEKELRWYVDGKEVHRVPNLFSHDPAQVRLSIDVPPNGVTPNVPDTTGGNSMEVDYVRVFKHSPPAVR